VRLDLTSRNRFLALFFAETAHGIAVAMAASTRGDQPGMQHRQLPVAIRLASPQARSAAGGVI
jgi:hypothetical protein